jgi:hypothetical protein
MAGDLNCVFRRAWKISPTLILVPSVIIQRKKMETKREALLDEELGRGGNFPRGDGSPRRPDPNGAGMGAEIPPRGSGAGPRNLNGAGVGNILHPRGTVGTRHEFGPSIIAAHLKPNITCTYINSQISETLTQVSFVLTPHGHTRRRRRPRLLLWSVRLPLNQLTSWQESYKKTRVTSTNPSLFAQRCW